MVFIGGLLYLPTLLTFHFQLINITGTLRTGKIYVNTVENTRGIYFKVTTKSQKAELIFFLNGYDQKFSLMENIGNNYQDEKFKKILDEMNFADSVTVWVKKSERKSYHPKVFEIDADKNPVLDFESVRTEHGIVTIFCLGLGALMLLFFYWTRKDGPLRNTRKYF